MIPRSQHTTRGTLPFWVHREKLCIMPANRVWSFLMKRNRLDWLVLFVFSTVLLIGDAAEAAARPPNVVIVLSDDLGWQDIGCS